MRWNRRRKRNQKRRKDKKLTGHQRPRIQHNENILYPKYRRFIRNEEKEMLQLLSEYEQCLEQTRNEERKRRLSILKTDNDTLIQSSLAYLDKAEHHLKNLLSQWLPQWDYDLNKKIDDIKNNLFDRFQTFVEQLDLSGMNLPDVELEALCQVSNPAGSSLNLLDYDGSSGDGAFIQELQRQLKTLENELEEEEISELACIRARESQCTKLDSDIELLTQELARLRPKQGIHVNALHD